MPFAKLVPGRVTSRDLSLQNAMSNLDERQSVSSSSSSGLSDFEDAAEGKTRENGEGAGLASDLEQQLSGEGEEKGPQVSHDGGKCDGDDSSDKGKDKSESASIVENGGQYSPPAKKKGRGVAALMAKFETKEDSDRTVRTSGVSAQTGRGDRVDDTGEGKDVLNGDVIPPSEGAASMLDPKETISNPFSEGAAEALTMTPKTTLKRLSESSQNIGGRIDDEAHNGPPDTPSTHANRFSTVSLGGASQAEPSRRRTLFATDFHAQQESIDEEETGSSAFLARNTARISLNEAQRNSLGNSERLKEKLEELRHAHSSHDEGDSKDNAADSDEGANDGDDAGVGSSRSASASNRQSRSSWEGPLRVEGDGSCPSDDNIDWDFWGDVMSNYQEIARTQPRKLSHAIQAGIPATLRGMMWQLMSSSKDEEMEIIYAFYLKQNSPHEKMIRKDLARTFPGQDYFQDGKGIGQENLYNVVKAYSLYDEECGYCQGMQFVVGPLLLNMPDEEAFSTLVRLMKSYDLRGHFVPNMPALQLRLFQFERLLEEFLPLLHRHLVRQGIKSSMYASGWIMTLFTYRSPLSICFRILDSVFAEGIEALFRFALALMRKNEDQLLTMPFDEAVPLLAARIFDVYKIEASSSSSSGNQYRSSEDGNSPETPNANANSSSQQDRLAGGMDGYRVEEFVQDAFAFKITPFMLDSYATDFAEQVKAATAHRREVEELKVENRGLQIRVKSLEDQLGAVQQEHVELVKSVVMAKLAKEEMAEELMRYKMMYAEAALLVDQSNVTQPSSQQAVSSPSFSEGTTGSARQSQQ